LLTFIKNPRVLEFYLHLKMENISLKDRILSLNNLTLKQLNQEVSYFQREDQKEIYKNVATKFWRPSYLDEYDYTFLKSTYIKAFGLAFVYPIIRSVVRNQNLMDKLKLRHSYIRKVLMFKHGVFIVGLLWIPICHDIIELFTRVGLKTHFKRKHFESMQQNPTT